MLQEVRDISCAVHNAHDFEGTRLRAINVVQLLAPYLRALLSLFEQ